MRKLFCFLLLVFCFFSANAQDCEYFDSGSGYNWSDYYTSYGQSPWLNSGRMLWDFLSNAVDQINNCPFSAYQYDGDPDSGSGDGDCVVSWSFCPTSYTGTAYEGFSVNQLSYLISPLLTVGGNASMHYSVRSLTGPTNPDHQECFDIKLSPQGGSEESDFTVSLFGAFGCVPSDSWHDWYLDLSSYAAQTIRIAFVHASVTEPTDMAGLLIDNVCFHNCIVDIDDFEKPSFSLYPNPTTTNITVEGEGEMEIVDLLGKIMAVEYVNGKANIDLSNLGSGIYFVRMNGATQKFIKK